MSRLLAFQAIFFLFTVPTLIYANDSPEKVLEEFNVSSTGKEAIGYLAGSMKSQFASINENQQEEWLKYSRMKVYQDQVVPINDHLQFVVVSDIEFVQKKEHSSQEEPVIYEFGKTADQWKIQERWSGYIIFDLFKQEFSPGLFHAKNFFEFDNQQVVMESAFAYIEKKKHDLGKSNIHIKFYPFPFQDRDIEFLKRGRGAAVGEINQATTIASSIKYPNVELNICLDENNQVVSFGLAYQNFINGDNQTHSIGFQSDSFIDKLVITENNLNLVTKGSSEMSPGQKTSWDINISLPFFEEGIN